MVGRPRTAQIHRSGSTAVANPVLVLSLFPGIGLLDMAFEEEGFIVVRGPDVLWGGDVRRFHPPAGHFEGVIGGPPCQAFSGLVNLIRAKGLEPRFGNLIPEFERCIAESRPQWFLMENVPAAPRPQPAGYAISDFTVCNSSLDGGDGLGLEQERVRRFSFGVQGSEPRDLRRHIQLAALRLPGRARAVTQTHVNNSPEAKRRPRARTQAVVADRRAVPVALGGSGKLKRSRLPAKDGHLVTYDWPTMCRLQGLPKDFLKDAPFTADGRRRAVANGVPLPMGRAVARAIWKVAVVLALVLALPACAARQAIPIAAGADLVTTEIVIARGGVELNPLPPLHSTGGRVALKAAGTAFLVWLCERLEADGHHQSAEILKWTAVGAWGGAAVWNANVAREQ